MSAATVLSKIPLSSARSISRPMNGVSCVRVRSVPNRALGDLRVEDPHRLGLALECGGFQLLVVEDRRGRLVGAKPHRYAHLGGNRLDPRCRVDRVSRRNPSPEPALIPRRTSASPC